MNEQPFTCSLSGVKLPTGINEVRIRAHDSIHKHGGVDLIVNLETGKSRPGGDL